MKVNSYDLKCYAKTYNDCRYWDGVHFFSHRERYQVWGSCRELTEHFYSELIARGYREKLGGG